MDLFHDIHSLTEILGDSSVSQLTAKLHCKNTMVQWQAQLVLKMNSLVFQVVLPHTTGNQLQ